MLPNDLLCRLDSKHLAPHPKLLSGTWATPDNAIKPREACRRRRRRANQKLAKLKFELHLQFDSDS